MAMVVMECCKHGVHPNSIVIVVTLMDCSETKALGGVHEIETVDGERATALTPDTGSGAEGGERRMR